MEVDRGADSSAIPSHSRTPSFPQLVSESFSTAGVLTASVDGDPSLRAATAFIVLANSSALLDRLAPLLLGIVMLALGLQVVDDEMEIIVLGDGGVGVASRHFTPSVEGERGAGLGSNKEV